MSRQYSNRPYIPSQHRVPLQMCDFASYPSSTQPNDTITTSSSNSSSWQLTDPVSCLHQQPTSSTIPPPPPIPTQNDFSYFQYPPHRHTLESSTSNRETNINETHPPCHFHYVEPNQQEPPRPLLPLSLVTAAATTTASAPHHRHYRLESPSASSFIRQPPWFDDEREDNNGTTQRSTRTNNHSKRQRSSVVSTPTSQTSQSYHQPHNHHSHHNERKRSRHEGMNNENDRTNAHHHHTPENVLQPQQQQQQYRSSSHHHYQPYTNHRHIQSQTQPTLLPRTPYNDNVSSLPRSSFEQRPQSMQRDRIEHAHEINNTNIHYGPHHRPIQSQPLPVQPRNIYHPSDHRQFLLESPPVALPRRHQPIPSPRSLYTQQQNHNHHHYQRSGITFDSVPQRGPLFHRTSMTTHLQQRPSTSFLTDLLHRVIDAHAASYTDNHAHYHHHHHHPPTASIDLIAYAWMSPSHEIFSLPAAFSIQFGDFFDLTIPDETPVVGLTDSELERLPTIIYTKSCTNIAADDKCAVCLSEYISGEKLKHLRCKHFFHSQCIDPWLKTSTRCPICRGEQTN